MRSAHLNLGAPTQLMPELAKKGVINDDFVKDPY